MKGEDAEIIQSVLAGNVDDFRELVERYHYSAERWAFQHVRNLSDAEGIAQGAVVEAYARLDTLNETHKFGGWLHSIVTNMAISCLRRRRPTVSYERISSTQDSEGFFERHSYYEDSRPDDLVERQEQEKLLHAAIGNLPPTYRFVITMFYFGSSSYKDIATRLDVSVSSVKSMLHRARQRLKKEMTRNG